MKLSNEIWKDIPGYDGLYQASGSGQIKKNDCTRIFGGKSFPVKERLLSLWVSGHGYYYVSLSKDGLHQSVTVHRLVAKTFHPISLFENAQVNHKDGNKLNNHYLNLEWCTAKENIQHAVRTGLMKSLKPIIDIRTNKVYPSIRQVSKSTGINEITVRRHLVGLRTKPSIFKYHTLNP